MLRHLACPRILGEMGATIYKIEPASGDEYRTNGPGFGMQKTDVDDPAFDYASMNKTFVSINLKSEEGSKLIHKMLDDADIMVTSFGIRPSQSWAWIGRASTEIIRIWFGVKCVAMANMGPIRTRRASMQRLMLLRWRLVRLPSSGGGGVSAYQLAGGNGGLECFPCFNRWTACCVSAQGPHGRRRQGHSNPAPLCPLAYADDAGLHPIW